MTFIALANVSINLARAAGVIKSSSDLVVRETQEDVRAIMRNDYNWGLAALENAQNYHDTARFEASLRTASEHFQKAAAQERLPRHLRGFACGVVAGLAYREGEDRVGRSYVESGIAHYDAAFRGIQRAARRAVDVIDTGHMSDSPAGRALEFSIGVMGPLLGPGALWAARRKRAEQLSARVPSRKWIRELNEQARSLLKLAEQKGVTTDGHSGGLLLERKKRLITRAELLPWTPLNEPSHSGRSHRRLDQMLAVEERSFDDVWARIAAHAGETFRTARGFEFTYRVPGDYVRITRDGREINRSLSRASFSKAFAQLPAAGPGALENVQGPSYTWAILTDKRIQGSL